MTTSQEGVPEADCLGCRRKVPCIRVADGTVYRPFAWTYTEPRWPLVGFCPQCQAHGDRSCDEPTCAWCTETRRMAAEERA